MPDPAPKYLRAAAGGAAPKSLSGGAGLVGCHAPQCEALIDAAPGDEVKCGARPYLHDVRILDIA
jgi:hypothetical protein